MALPAAGAIGGYQNVGSEGLIKHTSLSLPVSKLLPVRPNPIALFDVKSGHTFRSGEPTFIRRIPADRVEHVLTVLGQMVFQRLAGDDIGWNLWQELRHQAVERF